MIFQPASPAMANALVQDRVSAARADAIRSLIFVIISFGLLWAFFKQKIKVTVLSIAFLALMLADLWTIDRRYLKDEEFVDKQEALQPQPRPVDGLILRDKDPDFRVIDLSQTLLQDAITPYFYKSVGGYSAARLKRYDELIDNQFTKRINPAVLDMLNTKYVINPDTAKNLTVMANPTACGHAWFVKSVKYASKCDQKEMGPMSAAFRPKRVTIV